MPKICYTPCNFRAATRTMIDAANKIITEYAAAGYDLTLRQLYYQFVSRDLLGNTQANYKKLGSIINDARLAGLIDWNSITDRTRGVESITTWGDPSQIVSACAEQFKLDKWINQPFRPEVWIEKEALAGVFERICTEMRISYLSCRGYTSQSEMWRAAQRLKGFRRAGQTPIILHFGDHDPSGIDMSRDIADRLKLFMDGQPIKFERMALNMDQVDEYNPPPNPAKDTDVRFQSYSDTYGDESWELDALDPSVLAELVRTKVEDLLDKDLWEEKGLEEQAAKDKLVYVSDNWEELTEEL